MESSLLIGNGLNRCLQNGIPWGDLLKSIAETYGVDYNEHISMPMEFERIINEILKKSPSYGVEIYDKVKEMVADKVKNVVLPQDAIHYKLKNLPVNAVMTTNYDFLLEKVYDSNYNPNKHRNIAGIKEKYPWKATETVENKKFFHLHGMASSKNTLCLGYEHYMGIIEKARSELNSKARKTGEKHIYRKLAGLEEFSGSWAERFYNTNVVIVGLGLYQNEFDLWWLLTHRASLYYSDYNFIRSNKLLSNTITYFDIIDDINVSSKDDEKKRRNIMLNSMNVVVNEIKLSKTGTYSDAYRMIFEQIRREGLLG